MAKKKKKKATVKGKVTKKKVLKRKPAKKRILKKKASKKKSVSKVKAVKKLKENVIGEITHYFPHVRAAVIKLKAPLATGDAIKIKGHTTDLQQVVTSMQIDHVVVSDAKKGQEIGLLVESRVRQHDVVYKL
ncbi:MAG: hypothetical protein PHC54_01765 [Candidatus Omnitrophica bacterium]|nr:hypothetical protein [Candidatus Omnitrophota bacterium]MDD5591693.1 hypothetical protein [Candidatus Omnitrophota bacterium]